MRQFGCKKPIFGIFDKFRNKKTPKVFLGRPTSFLKNYLFSPRSLDKNSFVRSSFGFVKMSFGAPSSTMTP